MKAFVNVKNHCMITVLANNHSSIQVEGRMTRKTMRLQGCPSPISQSSSRRTCRSEYKTEGGIQFLKFPSNQNNATELASWDKGRWREHWKLANLWSRRSKSHGSKPEGKSEGKPEGKLQGGLAGSGKKNWKGNRNAIVKNGRENRLENGPEGRRTLANLWLGYPMINSIHWNMFAFNQNRGA